MRGCKFFAPIFGIVLACVPASAFSADSTSFNPVPITVMAKGGGGVPVGTVIAWPVATNPEDMDNWLECNGQSVNAAVYPELTAIVGGQVPDFRGLFLRGYGSQTHSQNNGTLKGLSSTVHSSSSIGTIQGDSIRNITGRIKALDVASDVFYMAPDASISKGDGVTQSYMYFDASRVVPTANEVRPVNRAVRYLIRARS